MNTTVGLHNPKILSSQATNLYTDSAVSLRLNPEGTVVTPAAYLLFYRRRGMSPLGGPFFERLWASNGQDSPSDSQANSRTHSPAGEGQRLSGVSSRNGSSSALRGVGAAYQAGSGGSREDGSSKTKQRTGAEDVLPAYSARDPQKHTTIEEDEGLGDMDDADGGTAGARYLSQNPQWSFDTLGHGETLSTFGPRTFESAKEDAEDLFEGDADHDSVRNEYSNLSAEDRDRMRDFMDEDDDLLDQEPDGRPRFGTPREELVPILEGIPGLEGYGDEETEAPVKEVRLDDEDGKE